MEIFIIILIGISLSMDAFSLSVLYGTLQTDLKHNLILSNIVGLFHFFMPLIGTYFGNFITKYIDPTFVTSTIFIIIGLSMILDILKKDKQVKILKFIEMFIFAFAVSIDSFSLGIGLNTFTNNYILSSFIFCLCSFFFTILGLTFGNRISFKVGNKASFIGGLILSSIGLIVLFN